MRRSKAIHRAVEQLDKSALSYGFNARLMVRIRERAREQRRTDIITGCVASVAIMAMVAYGAAAMSKIDLPRIDLSGIFKMMAHAREWGVMTLSIVAMLVADMYIRQYFRLRKFRKGQKTTK